MTLGDPESAINMVKGKYVEHQASADEAQMKHFNVSKYSNSQEPTKEALDQLSRDRNATSHDNSIIVPVGHVNSKLTSYQTSFLQTNLPIRG